MITMSVNGSTLSRRVRADEVQRPCPSLVEYGLTECSPLLAYRRTDDNLVTAGCFGKPFLDTEVLFIDPASLATPESDRKSLPLGEVGVVIGQRSPGHCATSHHKIRWELQKMNHCLLFVGGASVMEWPNGRNSRVQNNNVINQG